MKVARECMEKKCMVLQDRVLPCPRSTLEGISGRRAQGSLGKQSGWAVEVALRGRGSKTEAADQLSHC